MSCVPQRFVICQALLASRFSGSKSLAYRYALVVAAAGAECQQESILLLDDAVRLAGQGSSVVQVAPHSFDLPHP